MSNDIEIRPHADLTEADLSHAILTDADLRHAILTDADLRHADLSGTDLSHAILNGADLSHANLTDVDLRGANLRGADLSHANLTDVDLSGADLRGALIDSYIDAIDDLDAKILNQLSKGGRLDMSDWHTCETTHCRAGWAVVVAGDKGEQLDLVLGTSAAAGLIYAVSDPERPIPNFYMSESDALADIASRAKAQ